MYCCCGDPIIKPWREGCNWDPIDWINSATFVCLSLTNNLIFTEKNSLVLSFKNLFWRYKRHESWRSILSVAYMWRKIVLAIKFWFKVNYCLCIVVSNTYWSVFVLLFFVLYTLCCQFLWIIQFWLPLRYSLTFISLFVKGYRSSFTELIYYTYDICHDYYLYDMYRYQD